MFKKLALIALFVATTINAQGYGIPGCAIDDCDVMGSCNPYDLACICGNTTLIDNLWCCVSKACDATDAPDVVTTIRGWCSDEGFTALPASATCAPGYSYTGTPVTTATDFFNPATLSSTSHTAGGTQYSLSFITPSEITPMFGPKSTTASPATNTAGPKSTTASPNTNTVGTKSTTSATTTPTPGAAATHGAQALGLGIAVAGMMAVF